ncbi:excisionase [Bradyrhizobium roseum]|uniref:excisionase n=1 Tax=Bradyrhizobium roseum TaxID=3056648 RepID=UPI002622AF6F|nr:excisionase [Bradyrhizobium roseus]WKA29342.1 excisionase [Bradyrhizobium roseus]
MKKFKFACFDVEQVGPDTPLRLEVAARLAFPDGSIKIAGLRREIARGRLEYEVIAGKQFTTLADIKRMRERCRVKAKDLAFTSAQHSTRTALSERMPFGSSETVTGKSPRELLQARLNLNRQARQKKP